MSMPLNVTGAPVDPQPDGMTSTAQQVVTAQNEKKSPIPEVSEKDKKRHKAFKSKIDVCKSYRRKLVANWTVSIDYRRGKPFASQTDEDTVAVNLDWTMTKAKVAALYSQNPEVRVNMPAPQPWMTTFEQKVNDTLIMSGIESAMDECLPDCINAAGFGVVLVSYEALTEDAEVPSIDMASLPPELQAQAMQSGMLNGQPIPMETVPRVVDHRYVIQRISPADFLWPISFTGANFDNAPWLGRSGRVPWAEAVNKFGLKEEDKDSVLGEDKTTLDKLSHDVDKEKADADEMVGFDEIFYKDHTYDTESKSFSTIHHLVYVSGKDTPVIDEPWKGQQLDEETHAITGSLKCPLRVFTLTYITDETIPPSDSAIGRPQVNEINKSRTQMIRQRERSLPVRWFDVNRVDPTIQQGLMRGTWQNMIPVQGEGSRVIGEVARASMPQENFAFDKIAKNDLFDVYTVGTNQMGGGEGVETAKEADIVQTNFQVRIGRDRAKVAALFVGIAEVLGGLMCLYADPAQFGEGFDPSFCKALSYSILADSTVLVDAQQRLQRIDNFMNKYGKSGWVDLAPVMKEIATLTGLDPAVVRPPQPKPPEVPNISLRLTGAEDMMNPLLLAFMLKSGQAPPPELIEQAKALIQQAVVIPQPPTGQPPTDGSVPPGPPIAPPVGGPASMPTPPTPPPPGTGEANPNLTVMPAINKRSDGAQS